MSSETIRFKEHTSAALARHLGVDERLARRLQSAVLRRGGAVPAAMPEVSPRLLDEIRARTTVPRLERIEKATSAIDGFTKYLFRGDGEGVFEAVRIP